MNYLLEELKVRGGQEQLIMLLTDPAGAGKSTALKVAHLFLYELCLAIGSLWSDFTFFVTTYTGLAAMLLGGFIICKSAFVFTVGALAEEDKRIWRKVRILSIDETSSMPDGN